MTEKRTDPHRPSAIDPSNYELAAPMEGLPWYKAGPFMDYGSVSRNCDHCGKAIRYGVRFKYDNGGFVVFGERCTELIDLPDELRNRIGYEMNRVRIAAANERKKLRKEQEWVDRRAEMTTRNPDVVEFLEDMDTNEKFAFLLSMADAYEKWGSLTDGQINAVRKIMASRQAKAAEKIDEALALRDAPEAPEGRQTVVGTVASTRVDTSDYGSVRKMLLKLDDGNKVWGTMPSKVESTIYQDDNEFIGKRIELTATFTRKEEHFSFYKNPRGKVIS
jgi:hypothetical protein